MVMEMMMMIPMRSSSMTVTMAMISSLREGISTADFSLPESFSLSGVFRPAKAAENSLDASVDLLVKDAEGGCPKWARGPTPCPGAARGGPTPGLGVAPLRLSFGLPPSSGKIGILRCFPGGADLRKYGILTVLFPAEF